MHAIAPLIKKPALREIIVGKGTLVLCRYYSDATKIGTFLSKVTHQLVFNCKAHIVRNGKLWEQPAQDVLASLDAVICVQTAYVQLFRSEQLYKLAILQTLRFCKLWCEDFQA